MNNYTTSSIAEKMGVTRQVIAHHIRVGNLKATKKDLIWIITQKDYYTFYDWFEFDKNSNHGIKKIPTIKEYDKNPSIYNNDTKAKVKRNKEILEDRIIYKMKFKDLAEKYILKVITIRGIVNKEIEADY